MLCLRHELEEQVCCLEVAKRLKELGVKQEGIVSWQFFHGWGEHIDKCEVRHYSGFRVSSDNDEGVCAAFTVAEFGQMLMDGLIGSNKMALGGWRCEYEPLKKGGEGPNLFTEGKTEADARAEMLIYLLEKKLISIKK